MKWSWKLATVAGIDIFVHWTFLLLIGWIIIVYAARESSVAQIAWVIGFVLSIFGCVVLHELGHALTARRYGIATRDITLLPIGGVARLERMPENPIEEFLVAIAGPAVNVLIAAALFAALVALQGISELTRYQPWGGNFLLQLMAANIILVVFNLIPAFPMDGGRVLRAVLTHFSGDYVGATQVAASVGQAVAILFGIVGLFVLQNPFMLFIALFVYLGAQEEAHLVQMQSVFRGVPVRDAMMTRFRLMSADDTLDRAIQELLAGAQQDFPVVDHEQLVGLLLRSEVIKALHDGGRQQRVGDVMLREFPTVSDTEMLERTFQRMREANCSTMPVLRNGQLVGLITMENLGEWMMIRSALRSAKTASSQELVI